MTCQGTTERGSLWWDCPSTWGRGEAMVEVRRFASPEGRHKTKASFCESQREKAPGHRARRQPKSPRERQQRTRHMANCYGQSWPEAKAFGGMGHSVCVNWGQSSCLSVPGQCGLRGEGVWCLCVRARACTCACVCAYMYVCVLVWDCGDSQSGGSCTAGSL